VWTLRRDHRKARDLRGVGGWLLIFVLLVSLAILIDAHGLYVGRHGIWRELRALPRLSHLRSPRLFLFAVARHTVVALVVILRLVGLWLIVRRSSRTPAYWTVVSAVLMPLLVYSRALGAWEQRVAAALGYTLFPHVAFATEAVLGALGAALWCGYWIYSRRVLATFGSRGLNLFDDPALPGRQSQN
jgi:hypothetical protein